MPVFKPYVGVYERKKGLKTSRLYPDLYDKKGLNRSLYRNLLFTVVDKNHANKGLSRPDELYARAGLARGYLGSIWGLYLYHS